MRAGRRLRESTFLSYQSNSYRPLRLSGVGSGSVVPLDGDRLARGARVAIAVCVGVRVMRWGRVRRGRALVREAPTEPFGAVWAVRPEGEVGTRDWAARTGL